MRALGQAAGRTTAGLPELAAIAADSAASEEQRLRAIEILGKAADGRADGRVAEATRAGRAQWLAACEPVLKGGRPGKLFETCLRPASFAIPDGKERSRYLAAWLAANPDPGAKVEFLSRLEGLWSKAFDATDTVRAELSNSDPRVKLAAEKALDRIKDGFKAVSVILKYGLFR